MRKFSRRESVFWAVIAVIVAGGGLEAICILLFYAGIDISSGPFTGMLLLAAFVLLAIIFFVRKKSREW